jgi:hypothetical protein
MTKHKFATLWGLNYSEKREEGPTWWGRRTHKARHTTKVALGAISQVEQRMKVSFERLYVARQAVDSLSRSMSWWRLLNNVVYG